MAVFNGSVGKNGYAFWIEASEEINYTNDYYIINNKTTVRIKAVIQNGSSRTNTNGWQFCSRITGPVNGSGDVVASSQNLNTTVVSYHEAFVVYERTFEVTHADDGSGYADCVMWMQKDYYGGYDPGYCEAGGRLYLTTIPRKSSASIANNAITAGSTKSITITSKANSLTDTLVIKHNGSIIETLATKVGSGTTSYSVNWTPNVDTYAALNSAKSFIVVLEDQTYNGNTLIGTSTTNVTLTIPDSAKPTIDTVSFEEANDVVIAKRSALDLGTDEFLQGLSRIKTVVTSTNVGAATIKSGTIVFNNSITVQLSPRQNTTTICEGVSGSVISNGTNLGTVVTVKDSRDNESAQYTTKKYTVTPYSDPSFTASFDRCDVNGNNDDAGAYIKFKLNGSISAINNHNTKKWQIRYKEYGTQNWSEFASGVTADVIGTDYIYNNESETDVNRILKYNNTKVQFAADKKWLIRVESIDIFHDDNSPIYKDYVISVGADLLNFSGNGKAIGIGQLSTVSESSNERKLEIGMPTYINGVTLENYIKQVVRDMYFPIGKLYFTDGPEDPNNTIGGTWVRVTGRYIYASTDTSNANWINNPNESTYSGTNAQSHTLVEAEVPKHSHTKGTMKITGNVYYLMFDDGYSSTADGAFAWGGAPRTRTWQGANGGPASKHLAFNTDYNSGSGWTGSTSQYGGGGGHSHNVSYHSCHVWKRTA